MAGPDGFAVPFRATQALESRFKTSGLTRPPRPLYSAGFTTSGLPAGVANAPVAELVDALELKIEFRKECWFDSGQGHHEFYSSAHFFG